MRTFNAELQIITSTSYDKLVSMRRRALRVCLINVNNLECNATWKSNSEYFQYDCNPSLKIKEWTLEMKKRSVFPFVFLPPLRLGNI